MRPHSSPSLTLQPDRQFRSDEFIASASAILWMWQSETEGFSEAQNNLVVLKLIINIMSNKSLQIVLWPKSTPNTTTNSILNIIRNAQEFYEQDQAKRASFIRQTLDDTFKGKWAVIICPKDSKDVDVSFTNCLNDRGEEMCFDLIKKDSRYFFWKNP